MKKKKVDLRPTDKLKEAIDTLNIFTQRNLTEPIPILQDLDIENGHLISVPSPNKGTMGLIKGFIASVFSDKSRVEIFKKKEKIQNALTSAIDYLKAHYFMIEKLKHGNEAQKKLAEVAIDTINRYNELITNINQPATTWKDRFTRFLYDQNALTVDEEMAQHTISMPRKPATYFASTAPNSDHQLLNTKKISSSLFSVSSLTELQKSSTPLSVTPNPVERPTKQEMDAFRVKTIALLQHHTISTPMSEMLESFHKLPIEAVLHLKEGALKDKLEPLENIISLHQSISLFPGEVIKIKGAFQRKDSSQVGGIPIPESFQMFSESKQTGFPHPSQHAGWALSDNLIPHHPHRFDQMPLLFALCQKKDEMAHALLPQGSYNSKARELLRLKKQAFTEQQGFYLNLIEILVKAMLQAAPPEENIPYPESLIDTFFGDLEKHELAYDFLCQIFERIILDFIDRPFIRLQEEWLDKGHLDLNSKDSKQCLKACLDLYQEEWEIAFENLKLEKEKAVKALDALAFEFISMMGRLLGPPCRQIVLQQLSEKMGFPPPMLNPFEQFVQTALYKQVMGFLQELEIDLQADVAHNMAIAHWHLKYQLHSDIALFKARHFDDLKEKAAVITNELEVYYNSRYYYLRKDEKAL